MQKVGGAEADGPRFMPSLDPGSECFHEVASYCAAAYCATAYCAAAVKM